MQPRLPCLSGSFLRTYRHPLADALDLWEVDRSGGQNHDQKTIQKMTLQSYKADHLDQIALRLVDVCCRLRQMAQCARDESLTDVQLNDKKALQWLEELEKWSQKAAADVEIAVLRERGSRRASEAVARR